MSGELPWERVAADAQAQFLQVKWRSNGTAFFDIKYYTQQESKMAETAAALTKQEALKKAHEIAAALYFMPGGTMRERFIPQIIDAIYPRQRKRVPVGGLACVTRDNARGVWTRTDTLVERATLEHVVPSSVTDAQLVAALKLLDNEWED